MTSKQLTGAGVISLVLAGLAFFHTPAARGQVWIDGADRGPTVNLTSTSASVNTADVYDGGTLTNTNLNFGIDTVNVNGGTVYNAVGMGVTFQYIDGVLTPITGFVPCFISSLTLNSGVVGNSGDINQLTYINGSYTNTSAVSAYGYTGTIEFLTLAGNSANNTGTWGSIQDLQFADNAVGTATFIAVPGNPLARSLPTFAGIQAQYVNLANGNILFDLSSLGVFDNALASSFFANGISLTDLFDAYQVVGTNGLNSIGIVWDNQAFTIFDGNAFSAGWDLMNDDTLSWNGTPINWHATAMVPEPATLGLMGLACALLLFRRKHRA
ncbi:MAG: PEP-CTERM sorting domain-containing protein [Phycisphaerales bacterium]|nr:PEP-CTERM sorting domain-containing protein [Phycisphaerales bacterium]